jgi:TRAP-type C4-dicarboxylate transport system permease small subunit
MNLFQNQLNRISAWLTVVAGIALVAMMTIVILDVVGKYMFNQPVQGTLEIVAYYLMVPVVFLPLAHTEYTEEHIRIELFTQNMSKAHTRILDSAACLLSATYILIFAWAGTKKAWSMTKIYEQQELMHFNIELWAVRWIIPISCVILALTFLVKAYTGHHKKATAENHDYE